MMRSVSVGLALAGEAERRAAERTRDGAIRIGVLVAAGALGFGALVFASVGAVLLLAPATGAGVAALVVAAAWCVLAAAAAVTAAIRARRPSPPLLPPQAGERMLGALAEDLGRNSPVLAVAALVIGAVTASR